MAARLRLPFAVAGLYLGRIIVLGALGSAIGVPATLAMVLPDIFIDHDTPAAMYAKAGLDANGILAKTFEALGKDLKLDKVQLA